MNKSEDGTHFNEHCLFLNFNILNIRSTCLSFHHQKKGKSKIDSICSFLSIVLYCATKEDCWSFPVHSTTNNFLLA